MDIEAIVTNLPLYFEGLVTTVQLVILSLALGLVLAVPVGLLASSRSLAVNFLPKVYIYFFRGTPLIVQMYICLLYTSPSPRDRTRSRMPSSA